MSARALGIQAASLLLFVAAMSLAGRAKAQSYSVLHAFGSSGGASPSGALAFSGKLYGTTGAGGSQGNGCYGTAFQLGTDGSEFQSLHCWFWSDSLGATPNSGLVLSGTTLYGTTTATYQWYGYGTVFKLELNGAFTRLNEFEGTNGANPQGLVVSGDTMYGTTSSGGSLNQGTVFRVNTDGSALTTLKTFAGSDGSSPNGPLVLSGEWLYGTTAQLSASSATRGSVFAIRTNGSGFTLLRQFTGVDGAFPAAGLTLDGSILYGTTRAGGASDRGTVFRINVDGSGFGVLKSFNGYEGSWPMAGLVVSGSRLYGTTTYGANAYASSQSGYGTLFKVNTDGSGFVVLRRFAGGSDGTYPQAPLCIMNNALYGSTTSGGISNYGTVFKLVLPAAPTITIPPSEEVAVVGTAASFTVDSLGIEPLTYSWFFNGTNAIASGPAPVLNLSNIAFSEAGPYSVVISNSFGSVTSPPALLRVLPPSIVTNCAEADLRAVMAQGGQITIACDGMLTLGSSITVDKDTALDARGHLLTISGTNATRLFYIRSNVIFTAINVTLANGKETNGAGIYNDGGQLNLLGVALLNHFGTNWPESSYETGSLRGAAIYNRVGLVNATNCLFSDNVLRSGGQFSAWGGAIFNEGGSLCLESCIFSNNAVLAGDWTYADTNGLPAAGGAILNQGALEANACTFVRNTATAGGGGPVASINPGNSGGAAQGGALANFGWALLTRTVLASNTVVGGSGGMGGSPGFMNPVFGGVGGTAGSGYGAALFSTGSCILVNCTLAENTARGGHGGTGGGGGWYFDGHTGQIVVMPGGPGGPGGDGLGALFNSASLQLTNCTLAYNSCAAGTGGSGGPGNPLGPTGMAGTAAGALVTTNTVMINTLLAANSPTNFSGTFVDAGHNLSSDSSCAFSGESSRNNTDPELGPLADNGGTTWTAALLPGSPAIDAGDTACAPMIDQRGCPRPLGTASDIGAYEYGLPILVQASLTAGNELDIRVYAAPGQTCRLFASADFANWVPIGTNQIASGGSALFHDAVTGSPGRFYRASLP